jgi:hypothetical protein
VPRWPAGLHPAAGALPSAGGRARRIQVNHQRAYWHHQMADLHAATPTVIVNGAGRAASSAGPMGVGEKWDVQLVQVVTSSGLAVPVPTTAQVWRAMSGILLNLLMQTQNGGADDLGVICPILTAGESIAVVWSNGIPGDSAWATIRGTRHALDDYSGQAW